MLDGIQSNDKVIILGATNRLEDIDPVILRTGRFDRLIEVPIPDERGRFEILKIITRNMPGIQDLDLEDLVRRTKGFVGSDLLAIYQTAGIIASRKIIEKTKPKVEEIPKQDLESLCVHQEHFNEAIDSFLKERRSLREKKM